MLGKENHHQRIIVRFVLLFCLSLLFVACTTEEPATEEPVTEEPTSDVVVTEEPVDVVVTEEPDTDYPTYPCPVLQDFVLNSGLTQNGYVKNQFIFTGNPDAIDLIRPELNQRMNADFGLTAEVVGDLLAAVPLFDPLSPEAEIGIIGLYEISDALVQEWEDNGQTEELVWIVVDKFNEVAQDTNIVPPDLRFDVYPLAEPNYVVVDPGGLSGDPGSSGIEGNPGSSGIEGDPGSSGIEGDPVDVGAIVASGTDVSQLFTGQWAFTNINLVDSNGTRQVSESGEDVKIIIFDSSPFATGTHEISWAAEPFELCVSALITDASTSNTTIASSHGLFVAGLAHAVAPSSQIHLIQVLNDNLDGSLFTLLNALHVYVDGDEKLAMEEAGVIPTKTVINLSLGFEFDPFSEVLSDEAATATTNLREYIGRSTSALEESQAPGIPLVSLPSVLTRYSNLGNVIVAAAGNDSGPMQVPAAYKYVIGVAANNIDKGRACFSNQGNVAAPGGDSNLQGDEEGSAACALDLAAECAADTNCAKAVISLIHPDNIASGYAYWYGTSFSSPIVSGLAALVLENDFSTTATDAIPGLVQTGIYQGTCTTNASEPNSSHPMGAGVINALTTLGACP